MSLELQVGLIDLPEKNFLNILSLIQYLFQVTDSF